MIVLIDSSLKMNSKKRCEKCNVLMTKRHKQCSYCKSYLECKKDTCNNCNEYFKQMMEKQVCLIPDD